MNDGFGSQKPPIPEIVAWHCLRVTKLQLVLPELPETAHHGYGSALAFAATRTTDMLIAIIETGRAAMLSVCWAGMAAGAA